MNVKLRWISLFSDSSWIKTTASASDLCYELGVNGEKKVNENLDIVNKNGHNTFHNGKPGNFTSLREVIWIILWHRVSVPKKVLWLLKSFRWYVSMSLNLLDYTSRHCCGKMSEKLHSKAS